MICGITFCVMWMSQSEILSLDLFWIADSLGRHRAMDPEVIDETLLQWHMWVLEGLPALLFGVGSMTLDLALQSHQGALVSLFDFIAN